MLIKRLLYIAAIMALSALPLFAEDDIPPGEDFPPLEDEYTDPSQYHPPLAIKNSAKWKDLPPTEEERPLIELGDYTASFFKPMKGRLTGTADGTFSASLGSRDGIKKGMRFKVMREGGEFVHPVTGERLGRIEEFTGRAEVTGVENESATLTPISGDVREGDIIRISSAVVHAFFYQTTDVDWNLAENYYNRLKDSERFNLIDSAPGNVEDSEILREAQMQGAELAILLSKANKDGQVILRQRLIWVEDGAELDVRDIPLSRTFVQNSRLGEEYFIPQHKDYLSNYKLKYYAKLIEAGDFNADGITDIAISDGHDIMFYNQAPTLKGALGNAVIKGLRTHDHLRMQTVDLDRDGRDELLLTFRHNSGVRSSLYRYENRVFVSVWETDIFSRVINGRLYGQRYTFSEGFKGPVQLLDINSGTLTDEILVLPGSLNIYDFSQITLPGSGTGYITFDHRNHIRLLDDKGVTLWQSEASYGAPIKQVNSNDNLGMIGSENWFIANKFITDGVNAITVKRIAILNSISSTYYKSSQIIGLSPDGQAIKESLKADKLPRSIVDYALYGSELFIIAKTFVFDPIMLLKGEGIINAELYVYPLLVN